MAQCWRCKKRGVFLQLSKGGLCIHCTEEAADIAVNKIRELKTSKKKREEFCKELERQQIEEQIDVARSALKDSPFVFWDIALHFKREQQTRIKRSSSVQILHYDKEKQMAEIQGSEKECYATTLNSCTCRDYVTRKLPCKHIYKLAFAYSNVDSNLFSL